jgi:hypothetical protein
LTRSKIRIWECRNLYLLVDQVLPERAGILLEDRAQVFRPGYIRDAIAYGRAPANAERRHLLELSEARNPLPEDLASLTFTKVVVETFISAYMRTRGENVVVTPKEVRKFTEVALAMNFAPYRGKGAPTHLRRLRAFTQGRQLTWEGVARTYFNAYFLGRFIDRTGGKLSRPTIGLKVTNETITGALAVALEAISDFVILACEEIKAPVVFTKESGVETWQTAESHKPTLVTVTQHLLGQTDQPPTYEYLRVVELVKDTPPGISLVKLEQIRAASAYASDLAAAVSDLIVRSIGGVGPSLVLFGKFSIGDNDTLAKVVQTGIGWLFARATEMFVATELYGAKTGPRVEEPTSILDLLELER